MPSNSTASSPGTTIHVLVAYASSPAFVAAFEDAAGAPGAMLSRSAIPVPQDNYPLLELTRPLVADEFAWVVLAMDTNANGTFDGLHVDLPAVGPGRTGAVGMVAQREKVATPEPAVPERIPGTAVAGDAGSFGAQPPASNVTTNDPSTISTVTTYLSTAVLIGAITWSFWYRRRKAQQRSNTFRM